MTHRLESTHAGVKAVVEVLARALTDRPDDVRVVETEHKGSTLVELYVAPDDLGKVIGKQGRTAAALRALAASAAERAGKTVTLEIREGRPLTDCRILPLLSAILQFCNSAMLRSGMRWLRSGGLPGRMAFGARSS